jgi:AraC-like DNA-binding protein
MLHDNGLNIIIYGIISFGLLYFCKKQMGMKQLFWNKILLLVVFPLAILAQNPKTDLKKLSYDQLEQLYKDNAKDKTKQTTYANTYLSRAKNEGTTIDKARGYYLVSKLYEGNKSIQYLDSTIAFAKNSNDLKLPAYAYSRKAFTLQEQYKFREAIDNFILAQNEAKKNNIDFYYDAKLSIAALRSEELGEVPEALDLYRECYQYYKRKPIRTSKYSYIYQNVIFALADAHKALQQTDSATYYNQLGYQESKLTKNEFINGLFVLNEGANQVLKKNYKVALDSIHNALPKMIAYEDKDNVLASYYYLGKANKGLGNTTEAVKNFLKVDSIYQKGKKIYPELMDGYPYLIAYYKQKGDKTNQLKYLTTYMTIDSTLQRNYKELTKKLQKEYDTPQLLETKESLIHDLQNGEQRGFWIIGLLTLIVVVIGALGWRQYQLKKTYHLRFEKIMSEVTSTTNKDATATFVSKPMESNSNKTDIIGIATDLVKQILEKLAVFETQKGYLASGLTIQQLATILETNSKYLSQIIKVYREKTFINYINDLRIDYIITQLQTQKGWKNYTIQALALECGFNNAESFSSAFYKKTGLKPTYFIKELLELNK